MVEIDSNMDTKIFEAARTAHRVAMMTRGDKVLLVVRSALAVWLDVVKGKLRALFNRATAIAASESVSQIDSKALLGRDPIHALVAFFSVDWLLGHRHSSYEARCYANQWA